MNVMNKNEEVRNLLREMFANNDLGVVGFTNDNGSDYYWCPACGASGKTEGWCAPVASVDTIKHKPDCRLVKLEKLTHEEESESGS